MDRRKEGGDTVNYKGGMEEKKKERKKERGTEGRQDG